MNKQTKALICVMLGNIIFGFSFLFSKLALMEAVPTVLVATRFSVAFIVLNLIVIIGRFARKPDGTPLIAFSLRGKPKRDILLLALFQPIIYFATENYGILYTSSAFAGIIISVIPLGGILFDVLIMHSKVTKKQVICATFSIIGVAITTVGAKDMNSSVKGLILLLVAVVASSLYYVYSKKTNPYYSPLEQTYVMFGLGCITYVIAAAIQCRSDYASMIIAPFTKPVFWGSVIYLAVISSVVAFLLLNYGTKFVSVTRASIFANLSTVISIVAGVVVLHESFTWTQVVGAIVILGSVYIANRNNS